MLAEECGDLGLRPKRVPAHGVELDLDWPDIARAMVHLRTAQRVLVYIGRFPCDGAQSVYDGAQAVRWLDYLDAQQTLAIGASGPLPKKARGGPLRTHVFAAQKIKDAICDQLRDETGARPTVDLKRPDVRIVARFVGDGAQLWLDPCGDALHKRGYRQQSVQAPLRETLAAALLRFSRWQPGNPLIDLMTGSGTIAIEAAEMALGLAPGRSRRFAASRWRHFGAELAAYIGEVQQQAQDLAADRLRGAELPIGALDCDPQALQAARANLATAGLTGVIETAAADATAMQRPDPATTLVCNPPYGERIGGDDVEALYRKLGRKLGTFEGCELAIIDGHDRFRHAFGLRWENSLQWSNGPLTVHARRYILGAQSERSEGPAKGHGRRRRRPS